MSQPSHQIATREKLILVGLYLSKYDTGGLKRLGFESFAEAFNALGCALGSRPASIKNYRDEFDPLFPSPRKGWHNRPIRDYCLKVLEAYQHLDIDSFTGLIKSFVGYDENAWSELQAGESEEEQASQFAKRLVTGLAAEQYFESVQPSLTEFMGCALENTTRYGCGYDFRLRRDSLADFLAVEVKGLKDRAGSLSMTPREYEAAADLKHRFFLFVVKNFQEMPYHEIFQDPLSGRLQFTKAERVTVQVSWVTTV